MGALIQGFSCPVHHFSNRRKMIRSAAWCPFVRFSFHFNSLFNAIFASVAREQQRICARFCASAWRKLSLSLPARQLNENQRFRFGSARSLLPWSRWLCANDRGTASLGAAISPGDQTKAKTESRHSKFN